MDIEEKIKSEYSRHRIYSSRTTQISDVREKFNKVAEDLKFYLGYEF